MWDLPGPGLEPVFPALAVRFLTIAPPGKSKQASFYIQDTHRCEELAQLDAPRSAGIG